MFSDKFFQLLTKSKASEKLIVKETTPVTLNRILLLLLRATRFRNRLTY